VDVLIAGTLVPRYCTPELQQKIFKPSAWIIVSIDPIRLASRCLRSFVAPSI
jgi:hypothetical protein